MRLLARCILGGQVFISLQSRLIKKPPELAFNLIQHMGRKKLQPEHAHSYRLRVRLTKEDYDRLKSLQNSSQLRTFSEVVRVLLKEHNITIYHSDNSLNVAMEELVQLRRELNAIGNNINQIAKQLNGYELSSSQKKLLFLDSFDLLNTTILKIGDANRIISEMAKKWLQK